MWSLTGNLAISLSAWLTLALITKLTSPGVLGEYALAIALVGPVFTLSLLHLSTLQATDVRREHAFGDYMALRIWSTAGAIALTGGLAWYYWPERQRAYAIVAVALGLMARNFSDLCYGAFRRRERLDLVGRSMVLRALCGLSALALVLYTTRDIVAALAAKAVVAWVIAGAIDLPAASSLLADESDGSPLTPRWNPWTSFSIAVTALPIGLVVVLAELHVTAPRLIIEAVVGTHGLGIFVAVAAVAGLGGTLARSGSQAVVPRLAALYAAGDVAGMRSLLRRLTGYAVLLGAAGIVIAAVAGGPILRFVYDAEHARYGNLLVLFAAGSAITYLLSLHASVLTGIRRFREQAVLRALQLGLLIAVCTPLTSRYGLVGAACALLVSESFSLVLHRVTLTWCLRRDSADA